MAKSRFFKIIAGISAFAMLWVMVSCGGAKYTDGTYTGTAAGRNGDVVVSVTVNNGKIASVDIVQHEETAGLSDAAIAEIPAAIVKKNSTKVDAVSGATVTSKAIMAAVDAALANAGGKASSGKAEKARKNAAVTYTAGTYEGTAMGMNGPVTLEVTFSKDAITDIKVKSSKETGHVGDPVYPIMFKDAIEANGSGIDAVSGATFTSIAVKNALNDAAAKANASKIEDFKKNTVKHTAQKPIDETYDVIVVGAGGAGIAAAAQSVQNGYSVLIIEKNAEVGGNTVVSGGQFQSVMPYLVWEKDNPNATTGVCPQDGKTYDKVKMANGNIAVLKTILNWSEAPFDPAGAKDWFEAGDIDRLSKHGVHQEYLPVLKALKQEIKDYLAWAQPKLNSGLNEGSLTLFSTVNLHIFQTYYGGLRPNADFTSWIYGDYDLVCQFIKDGQELKDWLVDQGSAFDNATQPTIVGALWQRENDYLKKGPTAFQWGTYFQPPLNTINEAAGKNKILRRTEAKELIVENGKVTGVKAVMYDGTQVTAHATKGVVLATGGYAANVAKVMETNEYWAKDKITSRTQTTNRSSMQGDGIKMGQAVGADVTGLAYTQLMPISWIDNGQLAFGGGNYTVYINPTTGKRFVNETSERDVLSLKEFENGIERNKVQGVFIEIANSKQPIQGPYPYGTPGTDAWKTDVEWRQYERTIDQLGDLFKELGITADAAVVKQEIIDYDKALITGKESSLPINKTGWTALIGDAEKKADGSYDLSTYKLEGVPLKVRIMAPSTHHTMGGLKVDTGRHVLDKSGNVIKGLYAAGEVTGGIHGGNRLGGNAIVEIFVSGRTAANSIAKDN
ncbi:MAG: FAD-dependent oxidoreductase [Spirochaetaceae bacterium]|nr:FAD-dependent oxidoreductase [Spirochaetaceae bacterium]